MASFRYPASDFDNRAKLLSLMGSHWQNVYDGRQLVEDYMFARAQIEQQTFDNLQEAVDCVSRDTVPIYHRQRWRQLTLLLSQRNSAVLKYGDGAIYGNQSVTGLLYQYGQPAQLPVYAFPLSEELVHIPLLFNRLTEPSLSLTYGVDFIIRDGQLLLRADPFINPLLPQSPVYDDLAEVVDQSLTIWAYGCQEEKSYIHTHHGYVLGIEKKSSDGYRNLVRATSTALSLGSTIESLQRAISGWLHTPLTESEETVVLVQRDNNNLVISTDRKAYVFPLTATELVAVGDQLAAGSPLVDTLRFNEFQRGDVPADLFAISMGAGFISDTYADDLGFLNQSMPLVVETMDGKTKVSFSLGGFVGDVDAFWDAVHELGVDEGQTLANLLDIRGSSAGSEPGSASLPTTINPLQFLCQYVLRNNAFLVRVKTSKLPIGVDTNQAGWLRKIVPPWTAMILIYEFEVDDDDLQFVEAGDEFQFGLLESPGLTLGLDPLVESLTMTDLFDESVVARALGGYCLSGCDGSATESIPVDSTDPLDCGGLQIFNYTEPGDYVWKAPADGNILLSAGAGGGGGTGSSGANTGYGGGTGITASSWATSFAGGYAVLKDQEITIRVGNKGTGGMPGLSFAGTDGGATWAKDGATTLVLADYGRGGTALSGLGGKVEDSIGTSITAGSPGGAPGLDVSGSGGGGGGGLHNPGDAGSGPLGGKGGDVGGGDGGDSASDGHNATDVCAGGGAAGGSVLGLGNVGGDGYRGFLDLFFCPG